MSTTNEVRYTSRSITPPDRRSNTPPPKRRSNTPPPKRRSNTPPPKRRINTPSPRRRSNTPPPKRRSKSRSPLRSRVRGRSRSQDYEDASNPGNNLYITGLSTRVTTSDLESYFSREGKVTECQVVLDPRTRESRGFAFVTMDNVDDANRCIKYLNRSVLEGRLITVEKAKRKCGRTPTPGKYCGLREKRGTGRRRSRSHSPYRSRQREGSHSRSQRERSHSPYSRDTNRRRRERSLSVPGAPDAS